MPWGTHRVTKLHLHTNTLNTHLGLLYTFQRWLLVTLQGRLAGPLMKKGASHIERAGRREARAVLRRQDLSGLHAGRFDITWRHAACSTSEWLRLPHQAADVGFDFRPFRRP